MAMEPIESVIARAFPVELINTNRFEEWCADNIRERIQPAAANVIWELESRLASEKEKLEVQEKVNRDSWELFGNENPVKSVRSIRSKLARDIYDEEKRGEKIDLPLTTVEMENRIYQFSDLGRIRIVGTFYCDVKRLSSVLLTGNRFLNRYECPKGIKDFIYDPEKRDGLRGHRAHQLSVRIPFESDIIFGFEVQFMTLLQHAWDRRNHPIYEWIRENKELSSELKVNDFACSEALHVVDQQADRNWEKFLEEAKNGK